MPGFIVMDGFFESSTIDLDAHTSAPIGTTWTQPIQTGVASFNIVLNTREFRTANEDSDQILAVEGSTLPDEYYVNLFLDGVDTFGDDPMFLVARYVDTGNFYLYGMFADAETKDKTIHKVVATTITELATADVGNVSNVDGSIVIEASDTRKAMFYGTTTVNDTPTCTTTDNALTAAGSAGIAAGNLINADDDISTAWNGTSFAVIDFEDLQMMDEFFEESVDAELNLHTADTGEAWTEEEASGTSNVHTDTDNSTMEADVDVSDLITYSVDLVPTSAEYFIEIYFDRNALTSSTDDPFWLMGRFADTSNYYFSGTYVGGAAADKKMFKNVATTVTELATGDAGDPRGSQMKFELLNATKKLFFNGSEVFSDTDNAITAKGEAGFGLGSHAVSTDDISAAMDVAIWLVVDAGAVVAIPTISLVIAPYIPA